MILRSVLCISHFGHKLPLAITHYSLLINPSFSLFLLFIIH
jgi:hypothetical protein